ncbi:LodA/GoxA family CTQ-dependent oxidase [Methylorubrum sp. SB2]|uniref:LodA/GoxA family CTQ-dependent oxidase n=1 Tax=Methylorubrum subtropicum TaxID=3138812 RepID=UPI00313F392D
MSEPKESPYPPCLDCAGQSTERLIEMFVEMGQAKRIRLGQRPAERPVFRKLHGVAHARLEPRADLPADRRVGFLAQGPLAAWIRFSSDTAPTSPDLESTTGVGIKLFGVPGPNALGEDGATADLIMQNYPVFFVDDAKAMCEFTYAGTVLGDYPGYLAQHHRTRDILDRMQKVEGSVLTATYWGILPFRLGDEIVKYRLDPMTKAQNVPNEAPDYLATDLANRLAAGEYRFRLMIQRRTDPATMPLDQATVEWPHEKDSFVEVATLIVPRQDVNARGQPEYGQSLAFNIWRVPEANAPVPESSIATVRKAVYAASADLRHSANGQSLSDPSQPRPAVPPPVDSDDCIVRAVIHPAIGVARVGNSPDGWFVGPEVPDPEPLPPGAYRDANHALKRQAARFRIYGVNMKGRVIRELTGAQAGAEIEWTVRLANTKAAWYGFQLALDIPEAAAAPPTTLRNPGIARRKNLAITPKPRSISGRDQGPHAFDDGVFMDRQVYLGEIRTDAAGRLIVLGGHGKSASYDKSWAVTFANNDGWHDDVSDGPVTATVKIDGRPLPVTPAWIVVAPPNYGPQRKSVRTMWDLMRDVAITAGTLARPARPSFTRDILPIFRRLSGLQWVNAGFAAGFGWNGIYDFDSRKGIERLADNGPAGNEYRRVLANQFRRFEVDSWSPVPWPWVYGDAMNVPPAKTPRQHAVLSDTQLWCLDEWAAGRFEADYDPAYRPPTSIDEVPLAEQGDVLTRAALEFCLADAFHPGCEMTWPVRAASLYMEPFRIAHAHDGWVPPSSGEVLTADAISIPDGPLAGQYPGGLTQWMAVPWQTDTASCRSGYTKTYDPYVPTFWPARVPNQVLSKENYDIVVDEKQPMSERLAAFANRAAWIAPLGTTSYTDQINNMIAHFDHLGVVEVRDGPNDGAFPDKIEVEDRHAAIQDVIPEPHPAEAHASGQRLATVVNGAPLHAARTVDLSTIEKVRRFPAGLGPIKA